MVSHEQVAQAFAEGETKLKGSRMFIDGNAVYSYGYHFPIALRLNGGIYLFNKDGYSQSTSRHKNKVIRFISNYVNKIVEVNTQTIKELINKNIKTFEEQIINELEKEGGL